ncbi:hypothetical protein FB561_3358 [Kribbella amoyensis]|uniref:Uncharacterized protein n=1 Tax=Kribbella amoyensis TaxID=996641 RepID=A0A561BTL3_9ACTN|nr:hypothetical protein [Kribbella amoyensis]TWD82230.1 hypothetical protein FB561_3358 [Kribbella amoyensis]
MVTSDAFDPHPDRTRWLRRAGAAGVATAVLGIGSTGLAVAVLSARQPTTGSGSSGTSSSGDSWSSDGSGGTSDDNGGSSSNQGSDQGSGLGQAQQGSPVQGGSHGS